MSADLIPPKLIEEALKDKWIGRRLSVSDEFPPRPITHENQVVGFQLPGRSKRTGEIYTGTVYIGKEHRNKGLATKALKAFSETYPDAISYVHEHNQASRKAHANAGWKDTKRGVTGNRKSTVWKRAPKMRKTASQLADEVLVKTASRFADIIRKYVSRPPAKLPGLGLMKATGQAYKNPGNPLLAQAKRDALRRATDTELNVERALRVNSPMIPKDFGPYGISTGGRMQPRAPVPAKGSFSWG